MLIMINGCCILTYMQLTKLLCLLPSLFISLQYHLIKGSPEVKDIDHTINQSIRYSWIYIF
ncbi:hypothetical protein F383_20638 [Gossypium arboreum]|uniref:Uncharacterized protein n=1 Tax=Gossypium arboreum TaxID=29729 RepID=A0A0B0P167_GOSAR|nr:hypothetical protein F383_20638 [Gossypium arboreum]